MITTVAAKSPFGAAELHLSQNFFRL